MKKWCLKNSIGLSVTLAAYWTPLWKWEDPQQCAYFSLCLFKRVPSHESLTEVTAVHNVTLTVANDFPQVNELDVSISVAVRSLR